MKITRVETITVAVPLHEGSWHSAQYLPEGYSYGGAWVRLNWPEFPIVLLRFAAATAAAKAADVLATDARRFEGIESSNVPEPISLALLGADDTRGCSGNGAADGGAGLSCVEDEGDV